MKHRNDTIRWFYFCVSFRVPYEIYLMCTQIFLMNLVMLWKHELQCCYSWVYTFRHHRYLSLIIIAVALVEAIALTILHLQVSLLLPSTFITETVSSLATQINATEYNEERKNVPSVSLKVNTALLLSLSLASLAYHIARRKPISVSPWVLRCLCSGRRVWRLYLLRDSGLCVCSYL